MRDEPVKRRRIGVGLAVVLTVLLTGACAQGKQAQTAHESPAIDGVNSDLGPIALRNASIAPPSGSPSYAAGSAAELSLVIVNSGNADDNLISITTAAAASVSQFASASDAAPALSATEVASQSPAQSPSPSESSSAPTASAVAFPVAIPAGQRVSFGIADTDKVLVISGLLNQLYPATQIPITFTFQNAGTLTVMVPVRLSTPTSSPLVIPSVSGAP